MRITSGGRGFMGLRLPWALSWISMVCSIQVGKVPPPPPGRPGCAARSRPKMSETGHTVPDMNEPLSRYDVTDRRVREWPPFRPGRVRSRSRPGGMEQVREHPQRAPGRQGHQRCHGPRARPVRSRSRRQGRRVRRVQAPGPVIQPASRSPRPQSCVASCPLGDRLPDTPEHRPANNVTCYDIVS